MSVSVFSSQARIMRLFTRVMLVSLLSGISLLMVISSSAWAASEPKAGWTIRSIAQPTDFAPGAHDSYALLVSNVGGKATAAGAPFTISDVLPEHVQPVANGITGEDLSTGAGLSCTTVPLQCVGSNLASGETLLVLIKVSVEEGVRSSSCDVESPGVCNIASVSGGGAPSVSTTERTVFSSEQAPFGIQGFSMQAFDSDGLPSTQAGGHPYTLATTLDFTTDENGGEHYAPQDLKDAIVDLPSGFVGNPQTLPRCPLSSLLLNSNITACPPGSKIGTVIFQSTPDKFHASEQPVGELTSIYNLEPEPGFPAEFGFTYLGKPVYMYASTVRVDGQLRLRVATPGLPELDPMTVKLLFFGDPEQRDLGVSSQAPFLTNPVDCAAGPLSARAEVDTWQDPASQHGNVYPDVAETTVYPALGGCGMLGFAPSLGVTPETTLADESSGYRFTLENPQSESAVAPATPEVKDATVTLPEGVSISPSAANGLVACQASGPEGINIGEGQSTATGSPGAGEDIGDPEATELGAGHLGGNSSRYDDGLYHTAPGHCPGASTVGSVKITTPLLSAPLEGHVYVAQPGCGGPGQAGCTAEDATNGTLFGVYVEASGSGVIVKLAGRVSVDPASGQLTASFDETPELPFSSFVLSFNGGPGAPLANPEVCGPAITRADFTPWSSPFTLDAHSLPRFEVTGCQGSSSSLSSFSPSFVAGTADSAARAFTSFSVTISRHDREEDLSGVQVTTPPGLLGVLAGVARCAEVQAQTGSCPESSRIGIVHVAVGTGSRPFWTEGRVYLTGSYKGAPFGLSIIVPAQAGPFNLGNVVVRAAIAVNQLTGQITVTSDPLPQIIDGVPLRVQTVSVEVDRPWFMFNPDSCEAKQVTGVLESAQGTLEHVSSPFHASGCNDMPFDPAITIGTSGKTSRINGASLYVDIVDPPGDNVAGKVKVYLPKALPARLSTLRKACLAATFEANPATCPPGSIVAYGRTRTPVLANDLEGPGYLVSRGNQAFPELVFVLQGEGLRVDLHGETNIKHGITSSSFADIPDVPVDYFEGVFPEGPHSALAANRNLCKTKLTAPNRFVAYNGKTIERTTPIKVTGCAKTKAKKKKARKNGQKKARRANASDDRRVTPSQSRRTR